MRESAVTQVHVFQADDVLDWMDRPLCAVCGLLKVAKRHELPELPPEVAEVQARIVGETP